MRTCYLVGVLIRFKVRPVASHVLPIKSTRIAEMILKILMVE